MKRFAKRHGERFIQYELAASMQENKSKLNPFLSRHELAQRRMGFLCVT